MDNKLIIVKNKGFVVPEGYLKKAFKTFDSCIGGVSRLDGELAAYHSDKSLSVEDFMKQQTQIKDMDCVFYLGHHDGKFDPDDIQPFLLQAEGPDGAQIIKAAFFAEGNFPNFHSTDHTEEYNLLHEAVMPMMVDNYELAKGDMDKYHERLSATTFAKTLEGLTGARGAFCILLPNGDPIIVNAHNSMGGSYDWGQVSQHLNFDANEADQTPIIQKAKNVLSFLGGKTQATTPTPEVKPEVKPEAKPEVKPEATPAVVIPKEIGGHQSKSVKPVVSTKSGGHYEKVPTNLGGRHLKRWFRNTLKLGNKGDLPEGWAQMKEVWVPDDIAGPVKDLKELGKVVDMKASAPKTGLEAKAAADAKKQIPATSKVPTVVAQNVMTTDEKKAVRQHIDTLSNHISSPEDIVKSEMKFGSFSKQSGINLEDTFKWPIEALHGLSPKALALYAIELRRSYINKLAEEVVTAPAAPVEDTPNTEVVNDPPQKEVTTGNGGFSGLSFLSRKAG